MSQYIPTAIPIDDTYNNILKKIENLETSLSALKMVKIMSGINELGTQIDRLSRFNSKMNVLSENISKHNELLEPISRIANNKIIATEIEAKNREKEINLQIAKTFANSEGISEWEAYKRLSKQDQNNLLTGFVSGVFVGGLAAIIFENRSKL